MVTKRLLPAIVATFLFLTGCQWGNNDLNREEGRAPIDDTRSTRDGRSLNNDFTQNVENRNRFSVNDNQERSRTNNQYEVSDKAAKRIVSEIDEIDQAYVITTNNNAYVAATLSADNNRNQDNNRTTGDNRIRNDRRDTNLDDSMMNGRDNTRQNTRQNVNRNDATRNLTDNNDKNRRDAVMNVRDRGFRDDAISDDVKDKITKIVKDVDKNIDNVYVTTSPDFFDLTNNYVDDFQNGRPVEGFFDQIGNMIDRVFPENRK